LPEAPGPTARDDTVAFGQQPPHDAATHEAVGAGNQHPHSSRSEIGVDHHLYQLLEADFGPTRDPCGRELAIGEQRGSTSAGRTKRESIFTNFCQSRPDMAEGGGTQVGARVCIFPVPTNIGLGLWAAAACRHIAFDIVPSEPPIAPRIEVPQAQARSLFQLDAGDRRR